MSQVVERQDVFLAEADRFAREHAALRTPWAGETRGRALARFAALGFPTTREEEWRFTPVAPIAETPFRLAVGTDGAAALLARHALEEAAVAVVVNGRFAPELSSLGGLPPGVEVGSLAAALAADGDLANIVARPGTWEDRPFAALNTAFLDDGVLVRIAPKVVVERPVQILFVTAPGAAPAMAHPRAVVIAGAGSQARIVESYAGPAEPRYFTNAVVEIELGENAVLDHCRDQREGAAACHMGLVLARLARDSVFTSHNIALGGWLVRNDIVAVLDGEGAECTLNGLYFADGDSLVDNHTQIEHARPHCPSHELYKGILAGRARAVFNGKIIVRPGAQKTNAKQTNRALLLSDDAQINTKPQLEIFADDVKCTHGAAIGQLDEEAVFYLRARGLTAAEARDMLIHAFAGEILDRVQPESLRARLEAALFARLPRPA
ncbi:MAG TPA: Fe-S cluster assembly protein SufD [Vicinamibacterales bacterium]|nr:Fe-S cluster assembly protein SufD [Vicinamibacterales bacterium]